MGSESIRVLFDVDLFMLSLGISKVLILLSILIVAVLIPEIILVYVLHFKLDLVELYFISSHHLGVGLRYNISILLLRGCRGSDLLVAFLRSRLVDLLV